MSVQTVQPETGSAKSAENSGFGVICPAISLREVLEADP
jgi:hypothetical protein